LARGELNWIFFDSYTIIELINQNENYVRFSGELVITNALHLAEVHCHFLKEHNKQTADFWIRQLNFELINITTDIAIKGSSFKFENKKKKLSYADCIGYVTATEYNLKFLTGDNQFGYLEDVEFVK